MQIADETNFAIRILIAHAPFFSHAPPFISFLGHRFQCLWLTKSPSQAPGQNHNSGLQIGHSLILVQTASDLMFQGISAYYQDAGGMDELPYSNLTIAHKIFFSCSR